LTKYKDFSLFIEFYEIVQASTCSFGKTLGGYNNGTNFKKQQHGRLPGKAVNLQIQKAIIHDFI
jgi:hypothetical protein